MQSLRNIFWLGIKELRSFFRDWVLLGLVVYSFSLAIIAQAQSSSQELHNASIAYVDEDHSALSGRLARAFLPPFFQPARSVAQKDVDRLMDVGAYTFILNIPPHFERDLVGGRQPVLQINVDATAMVQAGIGSGYAAQILSDEIAKFLTRQDKPPPAPIGQVVRIAFNPNVVTSWFTSVMGVISSTTMLAIILAGAAVVREREHGTVEHLLVMPVTPFGIAMAKIWANEPDHRRRRRAVAGFCRKRAVARADRGLDPALSVRRAALPVFRHFGRGFSRHHRADHAATRPALYSGRRAPEPAFRRQYPARNCSRPGCGPSWRPRRQPISSRSPRPSSIVAPGSTWSGSVSSRSG